MKRMKTFLIYAILIVLFYLYTNLMIKIGLSRMNNNTNQETTVNNSVESTN